MWYMWCMGANTQWGWVGARVVSVAWDKGRVDAVVQMGGRGWCANTWCVGGKTQCGWLGERVGYALRGTRLV